ncbi:MAG: iron-containing alcohol dehydrogenase family protein [Christensenellaceae bacterium]
MNTFAVPDGVKIGSGILYPQLKTVIKKTDRVMLIVDKTVDALYGQDVYAFLEENAKEVKREFVHAGSLREALLMAYYIVNRDFDAVIAMGGGKVLDVGKYASSMSKRTFISIPTSISHDGVASPIAVLKCDHGAVRSLDCKIPEYIIMDIAIIKKAPEQLIIAGLGDLVSNITALRDWNKAVEKGKAKMDDFAYIISGTAVRAILQYTNPDIRDEAFLTQLAESIVLSGLAMNITGNTRPSSGAEHLISHAIDAIGKGSFHGIQAAMATVLVEYLYGGDYEFIRSFLKGFGIPVSFSELGLSYEEYAEVLKLARTTRKNRYTILDEISYDDESLKKIYEDLYGGIHA